MSVFLLPDGRAFHAGTYYPPRPMPGRPSFRQVLEAVREAWRDRRDDVEAERRDAGPRPRRRHSWARPSGSTGRPEPVDAGAAPGSRARRWPGREDPDARRLRRRAEVPALGGLEFLIRHAAAAQLRRQTPGRGHGAGARKPRRRPGTWPARTLAAMSRSALFDQLDGGFARYSVTRDWSVPHFEKMLYDNAQLLRVYVHWVRLGGTAGVPGSGGRGGRRAHRRLAPGLAGAGGGAGRSRGGPGTGRRRRRGPGLVPGRRHGRGRRARRGGQLPVDPRRSWPAAGPGGRRRRGAADERPHARGSVSRTVRRCIPDGRSAARRPRCGSGCGRCSGQARNRGRSPPAMTRWWPAGTDWPSRRWPRPAPCWTARSLWPPPNGSRRTWSACTGGRPRMAGPARLVRVSHDGAARGIGGLLEDYAFCAEGLLALYGATGRTRWYRLAEAILEAACARFAAGGSLEGHRRGVRAGLQRPGPACRRWTPSTTPPPAARPPSPARCWPTRPSPAPANTAPWPATSWPCCRRWPPGRPGWRAGCSRPAQAALAGPVEAAVVGPDTPQRAALHRELLLSPSPGLVVALDDGAAGQAVPCCGTGSRPRTARRGSSSAAAWSVSSRWVPSAAVRGTAGGPAMSRAWTRRCGPRARLSPGQRWQSR